jgi:hypothetical protein
MSQLELRPQRPQSLTRLLIPLITLLDLNDPIIIPIALEARHPICRNFVLKVNIRNGWTEVMRVQMFLGGDMLKPDPHGRFNVLYRLIFPVGIIAVLHSRIDDAPVVVGIAMGVQGDLLFYG